MGFDYRQDDLLHSGYLCCTGEGLGWLWPFLAEYPRDKIAVIDAACAIRPRPRSTSASVQVSVASY